jgi:hypothetical protein
MRRRLFTAEPRRNGGTRGEKRFKFLVFSALISVSPWLRGESESATVEQKTQGGRPPAVLLESFYGLGVGFTGPQGTANLRNPSDNSLAVGPNHIVQIVNSRMAVFTRKGALFDTTGKVLQAQRHLDHSRSAGVPIVECRRAAQRTE